MARMILDQLDPEIERLLELRAQRTGRSVEREAESILGLALAPGKKGRALKRDRLAVENDVRDILALGQRLPKDFDLKQFSDELSDGVG
ncbi:hypothetical protein Sa4125_46850 [Aureimonas sp. SA4125]|uniref:TraY domain-containing protein n=1 Tax=Aureimonas sp. SA4125 TaxID=2826993 RepID=UPI001CC4E57D|nr:TraY domain-containing protein [Aureimonas sp. SA4125]BDA87143.1 hypothetical protein Sa4125_46850 [Aureimonas sp. SA4125]